MAKDKTELLRLAERPQLAAYNWNDLSDKERGIVQSSMSAIYGKPFASNFVSAVAGSRYEQPHKNIFITNAMSGRRSPEELRKQGYVVQRESGAVRVWLHPSGQEIWELPANKSGPSLNLTSPPGPAANPIKTAIRKMIKEKRELADFQEQGKTDMLNLIAKARAAIGKPEYKDICLELEAYEQSWQESMKRASGLGTVSYAALSGEERREGGTEDQRLHDLQNWRVTEFPMLVKDLP